MSSTPSTPAMTTRSATVGRALILIGGVLAALSSWVNWGAKTRELGAARTAYTIPAKFVIDSAAGPGNPGIDNNNYPRPRIYNLAINLDF